MMAPGLHDPENVKEALESGKMDMVTFGRQSIADPYWPNKVKTGRIKDIVRCTRCGQCVAQIFQYKKITCSVNPTAGYERYLPELWRVNTPKMKKRIEQYMKKVEGLSD